MRIAQVITLFLPDFVGGATLVAARVAQGLRGRGHDVRVFCGRPHGDATPYATGTWEVDGVPVTGVNAAPGYAALDPRSYRHPEVVPAFTRFLEEFRPDVVHFHSIQALGAELLAAAAARGVPVVLTMHDWWWWCARLFLVDQHGFVCPPRVAPERCHCAPELDLTERRRYLDAMLAHADRVLTPSRFLADAALANGVPAARVRVTANGIDRPAHTAPRRPGPVRFGYFGGPDHRLKGLATLVAAADRVGAGGFELVLHVGRERRREGWTRVLDDRVGNRVTIPPAIADRVRLEPAFAPDALAAVLAGLDCLVVPSLMRESYSLVTREALAAGVPVIASDSGGPGEVIRPERNGLLFATGDAADLARAMRRFVLEPGLAPALRAGAATTPIPSVAAQLDELEAVYAEVASPAPAAEAARTPARAAEAARTPAPRAAAAAPPFGAVLFLAGADGAPFRYRVTHLRDALATRGIASRALWCGDPDAPAAIAAADAVVVYRAPMDAWLDDCLAYARGADTPLLFSCDDLLFDATVTPHDALAALPAAQRAWWLAATERYAATLRACDGFLASTTPLVAAAARLGVPAFLVPNGLGLRALAVVEELRKTARPRTDPDRVVLACTSGTTMHDLDLASIAPALARVLARRPHVRLVVGGHLRLPAALEPSRERIERQPFLPWPALLASLRRVDVQLAPLRLDDPFSDAKSAVKFLEAGALGLPTVASPTSDFRRAIRPGVNGALAATTDEWEAQLLALVDDPGLRRRLGAAAHADVFLHATPAVQVESLLAALAATRAARRRRPSPSPAPPPGVAAAPGRSDLEPDDLVLGTAVEAGDTPSGFLAPGRDLGQRFVAAAPGLARIDVRIGTDGRTPGQRLALRLCAHPGGPELRRASVDLRPYGDGAWVAFAFAPLAESAGRDLYFAVAPDGDGPAVTLWTYVRGHGDAPPPGQHVDHAPVAGSLSFRTFSAVR